METKYDKNKEQYDLKIKSKNNVKNMKEFVKSHQEISKNHKKGEKIFEQMHRLDSKNYPKNDE